MQPSPASRGHGYDFDVPLLPGDHVTSDTGTGFVHTAPGHGEDDFELILKNFPAYTREHPEAFNVVQEDGSFAASVPLFAGKFILSRDGKKDGDANRRGDRGADQGAARCSPKARCAHSYPHSWRSKAPVIFRATPQWFVAMDKPMPAISAATRCASAR